MKNVSRVRFWAYQNSTWIKLTIMKGQKVSFFYSEPTEEGFNSESAEYWFDGETIHLFRETWGRDCDGETSSKDELVCELGNIRSNHIECEGYGPGEAVPMWDEVSSRYRDYSAELMGY